MRNDIIESDNVIVEDLIYNIRGKELMLDSDLAKLYQVETKRINEAVRNNPKKFPERFSWILTNDEENDLRSKISTSSQRSQYGGRRYNTRVFTEQGVAMLATILKSKIATEVSIRIMDAFVTMRHYLNDNKNIYIALNNINNKLIEHDKKLDYLFSRFDKKEKIFLKEEVYDAYSEILDIFKEAKKELIIINGYADISLLDLIRNIKCDIILISKNKSKLLDNEIDKYNMQYHNLKVIKNDDYHDRYFILDRKEIYHSGASINYAGKRVFSINKLEDKVVIDTLIKSINKIL